MVEIIPEDDEEDNAYFIDQYYSGIYDEEIFDMFDFYINIPEN